MGPRTGVARLGHAPLYRSVGESYIMAPLHPHRATHPQELEGCEPRTPEGRKIRKNNPENFPTPSQSAGSEFGTSTRRFSSAAFFRPFSRSSRCKLLTFSGSAIDQWKFGLKSGGSKRAFPQGSSTVCVGALRHSTANKASFPLHALR